MNRISMDRGKDVGKISRFAGLFLSVLLVFSLILNGCSSSDSENTGEDSSIGSNENSTSQDQTTQRASSDNISDAVEIPGLTCEAVLPLDYAEGFAGYYYNDGFEVIEIYEDSTFLLVPEGAEAPQGIDEDIVVLQKPVDQIYLAASASMALFDAIDSVDSIKFSGLQEDAWYVESAKEAMNEGSITYAGKYREPDYEMLINSSCDLAIESTMISHSPKVKEMLETLGIPVMVDQSSYEPHPLGRAEWVKLYGMLVDKDDEAEAFFADQAKIMDEMDDFENTGLTVAYFYISSNGQAVVRSPEDYVAKMIEIGGGAYAFADIQNPNVRSTTISMTMEDFYAIAVDADYIIYNASIDQPIQTIDDLIGKNQLFENFKAVKEGKVWCTDRNFYQASDIAPQMIKDINLMLTDGDQDEMTFIYEVGR